MSNRSLTTTFMAVPIAVVLLALGSGPAGASPGTSSGDPKTGSVKTISLRSGPVNRTARLFIPATLPKKAKVPLVVVLHGGFGNAAGAAKQTGFDAQAARGKFLVVYPQGLLRSWNAGICCGPPQRNDVDDVQFIEQLVDRLERDYRVDTRRVYATGISNGGMMSYRLACETDRFAAVAPVAATLPVSDCAPSRPVSVLHIHGLEDENVPFDGGVGAKARQQRAIEYPPVRDGIDRFVRVDNCSSDSTRRPQGTVSTETWSGCRNGTGVRLVTISDGGHAWPGGQRMSNVLDVPSTALDATSTIWGFFRAHSRP